MRFAFHVLFLFTLFIPLGFSFAVEKVENAGFTEGIWFSKDPFVAGETIRIYTAVVNSSPQTISGSVEFFDGDRSLGKTAIAVPPNGGFKEASISWKVTEGYHKFYAVIKSAKQGANEAELKNNKTNATERIIEGETENKNATSTGALEEKIEIVKEYADKNLPPAVSNAFGSIGEILEDVRFAAQSYGEEWEGEAKAKLSELKEKKDSNANRSVAAAPFAYVQSFLSQLLSAIAGNKLFFYGTLLLVVLWLVRFIKNTFFF